MSKGLKDRDVFHVTFQAGTTDYMTGGHLGDLSGRHC